MTLMSGILRRPPKSQKTSPRLSPRALRPGFAAENSILERSSDISPRDLVERDALVEARLGREAEDALADDVALDLVGATPDRDRRGREEQREPVVLTDEPGEAANVDGQVGQGLDRAGASEHRPRPLGNGGATR